MSKQEQEIRTKELSLAWRYLDLAINYLDRSAELLEELSEPQLLEQLERVDLSILIGLRDSIEEQLDSRVVEKLSVEP